MRRLTHCFLVVLPLLLSACDGSTLIDPDDPIEEELLQELAVAAFEMAEAEGTPLPSFERLLRETYQTIRGTPEAYPEGVRFLRRGRSLAQKATEAAEAGDEEAAKAFAARSHSSFLQAILSVLGDEVAETALKGVDQALDRLEARIAGKTIPDRYRRALAQVHNLSERGHLALEAGNDPAGLNAALNAADLLRTIVPRYHAERAIQWATRAYSAAQDLVSGTEPTDQEKAALRQARGLLKEAKEAFRTREFRESVRLAKASASLSLGVLEGRSDG